MTAYDREFAADAASLDQVQPVTAATPGQAAPLDPWRALRFAIDGLERICMGTADEADSSSIAEKALFAAIGHLNVRDIPDSAIAAQDARPAPELAAAMAESRVRAEVLAEVLAAFGPSGSGHTARVGQVQIAKWRTRAGLTS